MHQEHIFCAAGGPKFENALAKAQAVGSNMVQIRVFRGRGRATLLVPIALPYTNEDSALRGIIIKREQNTHAWFQAHTGAELASSQAPKTSTELPATSLVLSAAAQCAASMGVDNVEHFVAAAAAHPLLRTITSPQYLKGMSSAAWGQHGSAPSARSSGDGAAVHSLSEYSQGLTAAQAAEAANRACAAAAIDAGICWWRWKCGYASVLRVSSGDP